MTCFNCFEDLDHHHLVILWLGSSKRVSGCYSALPPDLYLGRVFVPEDLQSSFAQCSRNPIQKVEDTDRV
eukprot:1813687-Amphidinium_carterae.2